MQKLLLPGLGALAVVSLFLLTSPKSSSERSVTNFSSKSEEREDEDGPERVRHHEYLMTRDPSTGQVPSERLLDATRALEQLAATSKTEGSKIQWTERGPNNIGGRTRAVLVDAADATGNTIWACSAGGGLWKTTNFKAATPTWTQVAGVSANLAITCIAQHPSNPAIIYVGTGEGFGNIDAVRGAGIYTTTNGGITWTLLASTTGAGAATSSLSYVQKLLVTANGDVYAAGKSALYCNTGGLMKSTNAGTSWTRVLGVSGGTCVASTDLNAMDIEMSASGDLYASTIDGPSGLGRIWKSPAGATAGNSGTWTNITPTGTFQRIDLECSKTNNNKIYALMQGATSAVGGVRVSTDGGATWSAIDITSWCDQGTASTDFSRGQAWYDLILAADPTNDAKVLAGGVDVMKTANSGTTWSQATQWAGGCGSIPIIHADIHAIKYFPGSSTEIIVGTDGGIYYSSDGGASFTSKNTGYNATQYYGIAINPTAGSNQLLAGAQDNGTHRISAAGIAAGTAVVGGDGGMTYIDTDNSNYQLASYVQGYVYLSTNGGTSFVQKTSLAADRFINPGDYDASVDNLYCGGPLQQLYRMASITSTLTTTALTLASSTNHGVSAVRVDPNTANRVWVAFSTGDGASAYVTPELYILNNANATVTKTAVTLPAGIATSGNYISSIDIEPGNASHVVLTLSNYSVTSVWESTNAGTTWTAIEGNLPDMPVRWVKFLPAGFYPSGRTQAVGGILLGTELGVWSTPLANGASTVWTANNAGMGNVRVDMIQLRTSDNMVGVATHGRGLFTGKFVATLPVTSLTFSGKLENNDAVLEWSTATEQNTQSFAVEKSVNGVSFTSIGTVAAAGNSSSRKDYSFTDKNLAPVNHYRLRTTDVDGSSRLSNVVVLKTTASRQQVTVFANPFRSAIDMRFATEAKLAKMQLLNMNGAIVAEKTANNINGQLQWNLPSNLAAGTYVLRTVADGNVFSQKVVKQ